MVRTSLKLYEFPPPEVQVGTFYDICLIGHVDDCTDWVEGENDPAVAIVNSERSPGNIVLAVYSQKEEQWKHFEIPPGRAFVVFARPCSVCADFGLARGWTRIMLTSPGEYELFYLAGKFNSREKSFLTDEYVQFRIRVASTTTPSPGSILDKVKPYLPYIGVFFGSFAIALPILLALTARREILPPLPPPYYAPPQTVPPSPPPPPLQPPGYPLVYGSGYSPVARGLYQQS